MNFQPYPLLFEPYFKEVIWGGGKLSSFLNKTIPKNTLPVGECWNICDRQEKQTPIANGELKGLTLGEAVKKYPKHIVGSGHSEDQPFPLIVKLIDSADRLSLQVHPDEFIISKYPGTEPKNELWYVLEHEPNALIFAGLRSDKTQLQFRTRLGTDKLEECLQIFNSHAGDAYWIPAGTVHAIGAGNLILEIQQNSDTTFRVYDWNRKDGTGNSRQLHVEEALDSIQFKDRSLPLIKADHGSISTNKKRTLTRSNKFFFAEELKIVSDFFGKTTPKSFHILSSVNSEFTVKYNTGEVLVPKGESCLIPASLDDYQINHQPNTAFAVIRSTLSM